MPGKADFKAATSAKLSIVAPRFELRFVGFVKLGMLCLSTACLDLPVGKGKTDLQILPSAPFVFAWLDEKGIGDSQLGGERAG